MTRPEIIGTSSDAIATFKLVCLYGLAEATRRPPGKLPLLAEDRSPDQHPEWLWNEVRRQWKRKERR